VPTPGGQVFATKCRPPLELVDASKNNIKSKAGKVIKLKYRVTNKDKFALSNGGLQLHIPDDVSISQVISPDGIQYVSSQQSITWWPLYFDKGSTLSFEVEMAINAHTTEKVLTVIGGVFVRPLSEGVPTCVGPSSNITVSIHDRRRWGKLFISSDNEMYIKAR